jgi:hypothetical protein
VSIAVEKLLNRLDRVKVTGPDRGAAACPLCQSRNGRPLTYRFLPDGRLLLHAFCGCDTADVLHAVGLTLSDLFPERLGEFKPERKPFDALTVLQAVAHEIMVTNLIAHDIACDGRSDAEQLERLSLAGNRLAAALPMIGETPVPEEIKRIRRAA